MFTLMQPGRQPLIDQPRFPAPDSEWPDVAAVPPPAEIAAEGRHDGPKDVHPPDPDEDDGC